MIAGLAFPDAYRPLLSFSMPVLFPERTLQPLLHWFSGGLRRRVRVDSRLRTEGRDWPAAAEIQTIDWTGVFWRKRNAC